MSEVDCCLGTYLLCDLRANTLDLLVHHLTNLASINLQPPVHKETWPLDNVPQLIWEPRKWRCPTAERPAQPDHSDALEPIRTPLDERIDEMGRADRDGLDGRTGNGGCRSQDGGDGFLDAVRHFGRGGGFVCGQDDVGDAGREVASGR